MKLRRSCDEFDQAVAGSRTDSAEGRKKENQMSDANQNTVNRNAGDPARSQRDPSRSHNQTRPLSTRSSGTEIDPELGAGIGQASAGAGLDEVIKQVDRKGKR
jgi:hypothetical protein